MQAMPAEEEEEEEVSTRAFQVQLRACVAVLEGRTPVGAHARGGQWCPNVGVELFDSPTSGGLEELPGGLLQDTIDRYGAYTDAFALTLLAEYRREVLEQLVFYLSGPRR